MGCGEMLYDLEFLDKDYMQNNQRIVDKFDMMNEDKFLSGEANPFRKHIRILECSDVTFIQTEITFIARRNHHWGGGALSYSWTDALTFIKAIERLREFADAVILYSS